MSEFLRTAVPLPWLITPYLPQLWWHLLPFRVSCPKEWPLLFFLKGQISEILDSNLLLFVLTLYRRLHFPSWLQQDLPSHMLFFIVKLAPAPMQRWGSTFLPLESERVCDCGRNDALYLPRLDHKRWDHFSVVFLGCLLFEPSCHAARKPMPHGEAACRSSSQQPQVSADSHELPNMELEKPLR